MILEVFGGGIHAWSGVLIGCLIAKLWAPEISKNSSGKAVRRVRKIRHSSIFAQIIRFSACSKETIRRMHFSSLVAIRRLDQSYDVFKTSTFSSEVNFLSEFNFVRFRPKSHSLDVVVMCARWAHYFRYTGRLIRP